MRSRDRKGGQRTNSEAGGRKKWVRVTKVKRQERHTGQNRPRGRKVILLGSTTLEKERPKADFQAVSAVKAPEDEGAGRGKGASSHIGAVLRLEHLLNSKDLHLRTSRSQYHTNKTELTVSSTIITRDKVRLQV
jgi:hypothetical protein